MRTADKRTQMLREGEIRKTIIYLAIPSIIGMIVNGIYNIVDTIFVGRLGTSAIGAVSIVFPFFLIIAAIGVGVGMGAASYISRSLGADQKQEAERTLATAVGLVLLFSLIFMIVGFFWLTPILKLFGATETILPFAVSYGKVLIFGAPVVMLKMTLNNMLRAEGSAQASMIALLAGAIMNIILDPIFIFTLNMGVQGAALATIISQIMALSFQLWYFFSGRSYLTLSIKNFQPSQTIIYQILKIGLPLFFTQGLNSVAMAMINFAASPYGDAAVAAMGIVKRVISIGMFAVFGYGQGFQPVAGFNYGAKQFKRLKQALTFSLKTTTAFTITTTLLFFFFTETVITWFSTDQEVLEIGSRALRAIAIPFPLLGFQMIYFALFQALGKAIPAGLLSVSRQGLLLIPAIIFLPRFIGLNGVILAQPLADGLTIFMTIILAVVINKKLEKEAHAYQNLMTNGEYQPQPIAKTSSSYSGN